MTIRQTIGSGAFILSTVATGLVQAQTFPDKPITMIVSYAAGATTDISARTLAAGAEKILGVPITVENKGGGGGTVSTGLLASKKPDGYTILVGSTAAITSRPMIMKVSYDPKNVVGMLQYSYFHNGSIVVNSNSPWKTIDEFIAHAKSKPGKSSAVAGAGGIAVGSQQMGVAALMKCKGLDFKMIPTQGGSKANTMLMGNHVDFTAGSGSHLPLVNDSVLRELVIFQREKDQNFPKVPRLKDIGCDWDYPPDVGIFVAVPKGLPPDVFKKLEETFTQVVQSDEFKAMLKRNYLPFDFKDRKALAAQLKAETEWYKKYFATMGVAIKN